MAADVPVRAGDLWLNDQSGKHGGWVVRVVRVTPLSVEFEVLRGPSRSLKSRHRKPRRAFLRDFKPRRAA
jgi:hypothetical protein